VFSNRVPSDRRPNAFTSALARVRERGPVVDLTTTNPTSAGFIYPADLLAPLADPAALIYRPASFGLDDARAAVAETYRERGLPISADRIVLTPSTSDAYSLLFKLLCDAGSRVLTPVPSYPLFDHLTALDAVEQARYGLAFHGSWAIDVHALDVAWNDRTRCVLAVTPNNPTGSILRDGDADELISRCTARRAALILDEVFWDYPLSAPLPEPVSLREPSALTFRLGGLSKTVGLPQVKLGWIALQGPEPAVADALDRLELICDTYLSVSTPVQLAARRLLERGATVRTQIQDRIRRNHAILGARLAGSPASVLPAEGGWSAVIRVPATRPEEAIVLDLIERDAVVVHPGYFFDFPNEAFLVVSLLPPPDLFDRGVQLLQDRLNAA
jgi:aspartate/methionine/tyrosine aminotransferase